MPRYNRYGYHDRRSMQERTLPKGVPATEEMVKKSRGRRRLALSAMVEMQDAGFTKLEDIDYVHASPDLLFRVGADPYRITREFAQWHKWLPKECRAEVSTRYVKRYGGRLYYETWVKNPRDDISLPSLVQFAEVMYATRPQYRASWEFQMALSTPLEEIETEMMLAQIHE